MFASTICLYIYLPYIKKNENIYIRELGKIPWKTLWKSPYTLERKNPYEREKKERKEKKRKENLYHNRTRGKSISQPNTSFPTADERSICSSTQKIDRIFGKKQNESEKTNKTNEQGFFQTKNR